MDFEKIVDYSVDQAVKLLAIDSPSGYTRAAAEYIMEVCRSLGLKPELTTKGGVLVCLNPDAPEERPMGTPWAAWWRRSWAMGVCA